MNALLLKLIAYGGSIGVVLFAAAAYPALLAEPAGFAAMAVFAAVMGAMTFAGGPTREDYEPRETVPIRAWVAPVGRVAMAGAVVAGGVLLYSERDRVGDEMRTAFFGAGPSDLIAESGGGEVVLTRFARGQFRAEVHLNDASMMMIIDTGATEVAIPYEEAARLGVDVDALDFSRQAMTANGVAYVAPTVIPVMRLGDIRLTNVEAVVAEEGRLSAGLLGMSFLGRLSEVSFRGRHLTLRQ